MGSITASPLELACERRFPAWTLYARAFSGSRVDADSLVQKAVSATLRVAERPATEAAIHGHVLTLIRRLALGSVGAAAARGRDASASVFRLLGTADEREARRWAGAATRRLRHLPRGYRRAIERALLRRPASTLEKLATVERASRDSLVATIESGLRNIAAGVRSAPASARPWEKRDGAHVVLESLIAYAQGALSGDEARDVASHAYRCHACGDRLGTMILLKAAATEAFTLPRVPRSVQKVSVIVLLAAVLGGGVALVRHFMPNPWKAHATHETVPGWFQEFLYRGGDARASTELARGLGLLVDGHYEAAIETLTPLVEARDGNTEASAYLGIARYLDGDSSRGTVRLLEAGTSSPRAGRLSRWYLANVLLTRGDVDRAMTHLDALTTTRDWFGRAAEALIEAIERERRPEGAVEAG